MQMAGVSKTSAAIKLCLDATGVPTTVDVYSSSCFPRYDADLASTIRAWRYSPYMVDGVALAVCTRVIFVYSQR